MDKAFKVFKLRLYNLKMEEQNKQLSDERKKLTLSIALFVEYVLLLNEVDPITARCAPAEKPITPIRLASIFNSEAFART